LSATSSQISENKICIYGFIAEGSHIIRVVEVIFQPYISPEAFKLASFCMILIEITVIYLNCWGTLVVRAATAMKDTK
jgi:hypothetical protein